MNICFLIHRKSEENNNRIIEGIINQIKIWKISGNGVLVDNEKEENCVNTFLQK